LPDIRITHTFITLTDFIPRNATPGDSYRIVSFKTGYLETVWWLYDWNITADVDYWPWVPFSGTQKMSVCRDFNCLVYRDALNTYIHQNQAKFRLKSFKNM
jgi:hypothetical protein